MLKGLVDHEPNVCAIEYQVLDDIIAYYVNYYQGTNRIKGSYIGGGGPQKYMRRRTWLGSDNLKRKGDLEGLEFEETIIISDEPVSDKTRYTLWTEEHKMALSLLTVCIVRFPVSLKQSVVINIKFRPIKRDEIFM